MWISAIFRKVHVLSEIHEYYLSIKKAPKPLQEKSFGAFNAILNPKVNVTEPDDLPKVLAHPRQGYSCNQRRFGQSHPEFVG
jgi:hypothetical protein